MLEQRRKGKPLIQTYTHTQTHQHTHTFCTLHMSVPVRT